MCGIAGVLHRGPPLEGARERDRLQAQAMAEALQHRGPDRRTAWVSASGRCHLGHARLEVIDKVTGDQPMGNEDGTVTVVFNGEIYNFQRLRAELQREGHVFRSRSDTEVLVHGYEAWGDALVERLDGMFAFALWDEPRQRLLLARDPAGKKPLFIYRDASRIAFASEMKAFWALPAVDDRLDRAFLPLYLAYGYVPTPGTPYRAIQKLPAASLLVVDERGESERRYWAADFSTRERRNPAQTVRALLEQAVEKRLVADVPLGAFLSGGIDSTLVVGLMSRLRDEPVETFSIGFADDARYDETHFARVAAARFGTRHHEFRVEAQSLDLLDALLEAYDEPFGDSSALPTSIVSRLTREHVTVALTGDGGDELFAGYPRFLGAVLAERVPAALLHLGRGLTSLLPHPDDFRSPWRRARRFLDAALLPPEQRLLRWIGYWPEDPRTVLTPEALAAAGPVDREASFREALARAEGAGPLGQILSVNFETYLLDDLLVKADRCSMMHGLELRSPFLDRAVIEFASGLPDRQRIRGRELKTLLKRAFSDLLPPEIVNRPKMGFGVPLPAWLRGRWRGPLEEALLSPGARILQWVRADAIRSKIRDHTAGRADHGHALWALFVLARWLERGRFSEPAD